MKIVKISEINMRKLKSGFLPVLFLVSILVMPLLVRADATEPIGAAMRSITTLLFIAAFTVLAAITLLAIAIMLIIRYIYLTILLILSPVVWLLWIFPSTAGHWKKWWSEFIRWSMFAPLVLFFIYLTITVITKFPDYWAQYSKNVNAVENQGFAIDFAYIANLVAVVGLLMGGLFTANKMGITFASTAYGWASGTGKWFGGWVGRKGTQLGTLPFRYKWGKPGEEKGIAERMLGTGTKRGRLLKTLSAPIRYAGEGLSRVAATGGEKLVADAKKRLAGYDLKRIAEMFHTLDTPGQLAAVQMLADDKSLDLIPDGKKYVSQDMKNKFLQYSIPLPTFSNIERSFGFNIKMREKAEEIDNLIKQGVSPDDAKIKGLKEEVRKEGNIFAQGFRPAHANRTQVDELFKPIADLKPDHPDYSKKKPEFGFGYHGQAAIQEGNERAFLETNPDVLAGFYRNMKGRQFTAFHEGVMKQIEELAAEAAKTEKRYEGKPGLWLREQRGGLFTIYTSPGMRTMGITLPEEWRKQAREKEEGEEKKESEEKKEWREERGYL